MKYDVIIRITVEVSDSDAVRAAAWQIVASPRQAPEGTAATQPFADQAASTIEYALNAVLSSPPMVKAYRDLMARTPGLTEDWTVTVPIDEIKPTPPTVRKHPRR